MKIKILDGAILLEEEKKTVLLDPASQPSGSFDLVLFGQGEADAHQGNTLTWPGEYELADVLVEGIAAGEQTIYRANLENISVMSLLLLKDTKPEELGQLLEGVEGADIVFFTLPATADEKLSTAWKKLLEKLDPSFLVYVSGADSAGTATLSKAFGVSPESQDELKLGRSEVEREELKLLALNA